MNILIVDDEKDVRGYLRQLLGDQGHAVFEAVNGREGLARARERRPDVIISDGLMPEMDGYQLLQALKSDASLSSVPFIFFSAVYTGEREQSLALSMGADAFLVKPQKPQAILNAIREVTRGHEVSAQQHSPSIRSDAAFAREYARIVATTLEHKVWELRNASDEWRSTFDAMTESVALLDADGRIIRCNKAMTLLTGRPYAEIIGRACDELCACFGGSREECPFIRSKKTFKRESAVFKQGEQWFEASADPIVDSAGTVQGAVHILQEITGRKSLEDTLRESENKFRNIFEFANDSVFIIDMTGKFIDLNRTGYERLGYTKEEMLAKRVSELDPPEFATKVPERMAQIAKYGKAVFESVHKKKDGTTMPVEINARTIVYEGRKAILSVIRDITERKNAEEILRKRELQLAESQRLASIGSWERDIATNVVVWSKELFRILGLEPERVTPSFEAFTELIHPDDREGQIRTVREAIQGKIPYSTDFRIVRPDGKITLLHSQGEVVCDETGKPVLLRGTAQDITERKRIEETLKTNEEKFRDLFENANDAIFLLDSEQRFIDANKAGEALTGYTREELLRLKVFDLIPPEQTPRSDAEFRKLREEGSYEKFNGQIRKKNGSRVYIDVSSSGIIKDGRMTGSRDIVRDITERRRAEEALLEQKRFTESLIMNSAIATFVVDAAHKVLIWNKACVELTGVPSAEMIGTNGQWKPFYEHERPVLADIVLGTEPEKLASLYDSFSLSTLTQDGIHAEGWFANLNGGDRYIVFDAAPIHDGNGHIIAAIETLQDLTERKRAEESIKESEERYRNLFENANDMIQSVAPDGHFIYVNPSWQKTLGYDQEDLRTLTIFDILHPSCKDHCMNLFRKAMSGEQIDHLDALFIAKDGRLVDIEGAASVRILDGKVVATQGILHDVTEKKKLEEQIFRSKQDWEYTFNSITDMVTVHDADYNIILANKAAEKILKLPILEKMKEKKCFAYYHGTDHAPEGCPSCGCLQTGVSATFEIFEPHLGMFIEIRAIPRFDSSGSLIGLIHVVRDITERKKAEEAIERYNKQLIALNTASNSLMASTSLRDIYQRICDIIISVFDVKMVWLGIIEQSSYLVHPVAHAGEEAGYLDVVAVTWDDSSTGRGPTGEAIRTGKPAMARVDDVLYAPWRDEARKRGYRSSMAVPLQAQNGLCIGALNFYREEEAFSLDSMRLTQIFANQAAIAIENARLVEGLETKVFERTRALEDTNLEIQTVNKELVLRREEADAASRSKTDFLANMSHELRTPLNAIMGFSEIMLMGMAGPVSEKQREFLGDISKSGNHLLSLINDILDLSKVEAGKMELEPELISVAELISGSQMMFKEKALKHAIKMETDLDASPEEIVGDRRKLKQVLVNLLSNAFKFTPDGGNVRVTARRVGSQEFGVRGSETMKDSSESGVGSSERQQKGFNSELRTQNAELHGDFVEISVADTGVGISKEHQQKLFQPFQQIDSSLTRNHAGTGLGLSLCRRLVELHGGRIWVESKPGKGSTFRFVVPIGKK